MGMGFEAWGAHSCPTQTWVTPPPPSLGVFSWGKLKLVIFETYVYAHTPVYLSDPLMLKTFLCLKKPDLDAEFHHKLVFNDITIQPCIINRKNSLEPREQQKYFAGSIHRGRVQ